MSDPGESFVAREDKSVYETGEPVHYEVRDGIATLTMDRPQFNNAQNSQMTYALDAGFRRAVDDDAVKVIVLRGSGKHSLRALAEATGARAVRLGREPANINTEADLAVLDTDIFACDPVAIRDTRVVATIVGGVPRHGG